MKTLQDYQNEWDIAIEKGSFLSEKHDINKPAVYDKFRTVIALPVSASLKEIFKNRLYDIDHYKDGSRKDYFVVTPHNFDTTGFAIESGSFDYSANYDKIAVYSGSLQSWHCCAETSSMVSQKINEGKLVLTGSYKFINPEQ